MKPKVLCVEDDPTMQTLIAGSLRDYSVVMSTNLTDARQKLESENFDALILDILLPDGDGLQFWSRLAIEPNFKDLPVLFLTGKNETSSKVQAFSAGAEDFITKPFDPLELQARLGRRLKAKASSKEGETLRHVGNLEIDLTRQTASLMVNGKPRDLALTAIELKILVLFSKSMDHVYSRAEMLEQVWGTAHVSDRTVDSHIAHLRAKIADSSVEIQTVKNLGYRLSKKS